MLGPLHAHPAAKQGFDMRKLNWPCAALIIAIGLTSGCASAPAPSCVATAAEKPKTLMRGPDPGMQALQRRLYERDKQIAELKTQLETLKHIDMDVRINKKANLSSQDPLR